MKGSFSASEPSAVIRHYTICGLFGCLSRQVSLYKMCITNGGSGITTDFQLHTSIALNVGPLILEPVPFPRIFTFYTPAILSRMEKNTVKACVGKLCLLFSRLMGVYVFLC